jgi:hypothetical protein
VQRADLARALRAVALSTAVLAVPAAAYLVWRLAEFGQWLPNTAIAKAGGARSFV